MPEVINCPQCERKLQVPETLLGQDVQCPTCNATFVATAGGSTNAGPAAPPAPAPSYPIDKPLQRDYDDDYDRPIRRRHRDYVPHRGGMILAFGIIGLVVCQLFGIFAWVMGNSDLAEIRAGRMDPEGEGLTNAGRICGMIATIMMIVTVVMSLLIFCLYFVLIAVIVSNAK